MGSGRRCDRLRTVKIQENVPLAPFTTFKVGGPARYFIEAASEDELREAFRWAEQGGLRPFVLGGGSNLLVADEGFDGLVLRIVLRGVKQDGDRFEVGAGEGWDEFVDRAVAANCAGVECLAGIPGSVGATPVQNVGAYGQEVAETIQSVRALDRNGGEFVELTAEDCRFRYRTSLFNKEEPGRFVIASVRFRLRPGGAPTLKYADLQRHFAGREGTPGLAEVAEAVRGIRRSKGMVIEAGDPDTQSAGSYFKNPVVAAARVHGMAAAAGMEAGKVPVFPAGEGCVKLSAAWLVERAGFAKGFRLGAAGVSTKHTLALTNRGEATCADVLRLEETVRAGVRERFGVELEREPVLLQPSRSKETDSVAVNP